MGECSYLFRLGWVSSASCLGQDLALTVLYGAGDDVFFLYKPIKEGLELLRGGARKQHLDLPGQTSRRGGALSFQNFPCDVLFTIDEKEGEGQAC